MNPFLITKYEKMKIPIIENIFYFLTMSLFLKNIAIKLFKKIYFTEFTSRILKTFFLFPEFISRIKSLQELNQKVWKCPFEVLECVGALLLFYALMIYFHSVYYNNALILPF